MGVGIGVRHGPVGLFGFSINGGKQSTTTTVTDGVGLTVGDGVGLTVGDGVSPACAAEETETMAKNTAKMVTIAAIGRNLRTVVLRWL
jgi:hypothetical protein